VLTTANAAGTDGLTCRTPKRTDRWAIELLLDPPHRECMTSTLQ
jgi:hypothetical protein